MLTQAARGEMFSYQLTPIGAAMPGLFVAEEIRRASSTDELALFSFAVKGGKPRAMISWMVTTLEWRRQGGIPAGSDRPGMGEDWQGYDGGRAHQE